MADEADRQLRAGLAALMGLAMGNEIPPTVVAAWQVLSTGKEMTGRLEAKGDIGREDAEATLAFTEAVMMLMAAVATDELARLAAEGSGDGPGRPPGFTGRWGPLQAGPGGLGWPAG